MIRTWNSVPGTGDILRTGPDARVREGARVVTGASPDALSGFGLPFLDGASARGYFTPDEDELVRVRYAQYLGVRSALLSTLVELEKACAPSRGGWLGQLPAFMVAFSAACLLLRQARGLVALAGTHPLLARKLDEASPLHGIPRKTFTGLYRSTTDPLRLARFRAAAQFYGKHRTRIVGCSGDPALSEVIALLAGEEEWIERRKRDIVRHRLAYGWHSFLRRHRSAWQQSVFGVFEWSGRAISELRQPGMKPSGAPKRVTPELREKILRLAKPGDVFVTRHDDAVTNLFLPGYWPHAALFVGGGAWRPGSDAPTDSGLSGPEVFLEAKKDGVRFRPAADTLEVDALVILRPPLSPADLAGALDRAMGHAGKPYDFSFDFRTADRLACTEVIYRGYHGIGGLAFSLIETGGRLCLPAEELISQALPQGFRVIAACGIGKNEIVSGTRAELLLHSSRTSL